MNATGTLRPSASSFGNAGNARFKLPQIQIIHSAADGDADQDQGESECERQFHASKSRFAGFAVERKPLTPSNLQQLDLFVVPGGGFAEGLCLVFAALDDVLVQNRIVRHGIIPVVARHAK